MTLGTDSYGPYTPHPSHDPSRDDRPPPATAMSWWALGLAIVPIPLAWPVAVGLAIAVLRRARDGRKHGQGQAVAALVIAALWAVVAMFTVVALLIAAGESETSGDEPVSSAGHVSVYDLKVGDCLPEDAMGEEMVTTIELVPCTQPHVGEVYATFDLGGEEYPGEEEAVRLSDGGCLKRIEDATGMTWEEMPYDMDYLYPTGFDWPEDREVVCVALLPEPARGTLEDIAAEELARWDSGSA